MSEFEKAIQFCEDYVEKADKLASLPFTRHLRENKTGFRIKGTRRDDDSWELTVEEHGPSESDMDAFLLTFRMFFHERGELSVQKLAQLYKAYKLNPDNTRNLEHRIAEYHAYFASAPNLTIEGVDGVPSPLTRHFLVRLFLHGAHGHLDPEYRAVFRVLRGSPLILVALSFSLTDALLSALRFIEQVGHPACVGAKRDLSPFLPKTPESGGSLHGN